MASLVIEPSTTGVLSTPGRGKEKAGVVYQWYECEHSDNGSNSNYRNKQRDIVASCLMECPCITSQSLSSRTVAYSSTVLQNESGYIRTSRLSTSMIHQPQLLSCRDRKPPEPSPKSMGIGNTPIGVQRKWERRGSGVT